MNYLEEEYIVKHLNGAHRKSEWLFGKLDIFLNDFKILKNNYLIEINLEASAIVRAFYNIEKLLSEVEKILYSIFSYNQESFLIDRDSNQTKIDEPIKNVERLESLREIEKKLSHFEIPECQNSRVAIEKLCQRKLDQIIARIKRFITELSTSETENLNNNKGGKVIDGSKVVETNLIKNHINSIFQIDPNKKETILNIYANARSLYMISSLQSEAVEIARFKVPKISLILHPITKYLENLFLLMIEDEKITLEIFPYSLAANANQLIYNKALEKIKVIIRGSIDSLLENIYHPMTFGIFIESKKKIASLIDNLDHASENIKNLVKFSIEQLDLAFPKFFFETLSYIESWDSSTQFENSKKKIEATEKSFTHGNNIIEDLTKFLGILIKSLIPSIEIINNDLSQHEFFSQINFPPFVHFIDKATENFINKLFSMRHHKTSEETYAYRFNNLNYIIEFLCPNDEKPAAIGNSLDNLLLLRYDNLDRLINCVSTTSDILFKDFSSLTQAKKLYESFLDGLNNFIKATKSSTKLSPDCRIQIKKTTCMIAISAQRVFICKCKYIASNEEIENFTYSENNLIKLLCKSFELA